MKKGKKKALVLLLTGSVLAGGAGTLPILAQNQKETPPEVGDHVPLRDLVIKFLAIPELEPNRYTKNGTGKFAPEEMEKGLLLGAEMKYGPGNPEGMMAPLKYSLADIAAELTFDTTTGEIIIKYNDLILRMNEGSNEAVLKKNGIVENLKIPDGLEPYFVEVEGEMTPDGEPYVACYLPVKFTAETLGGNVSWDDDMRRLVMEFALYYTVSAVEPVIDSSSPYTTKKLEGDSYSYEKIKEIAVGSDVKPIKKTQYDTKKRKKTPSDAECGEGTRSNARREKAKKAKATRSEASRSDAEWLETTKPNIEKPQTTHSDAVRSSRTKDKDELIKAALAVVNENYQNKDGGWGKTNKDYDLLDDDFATLYGHAYSTFDNGATGGHIKFLARLLRVSKEFPEAFVGYENDLETIEKGFWKAINYVANAQTDGGGWPQYYPYGVGYFKMITYNDNAMTTIMNLVYAMTHEEGLMDSKLCEDFAWVREELNNESPNPYVTEYKITEDTLLDMWDLALQFTLDCQVEIDDDLTGWAQQYDPFTNEPTMGRGFELPSVSTSESEGIMKVLTNIVEPDDDVKMAVEKYVEWTSEIGEEGFKSVNVSDRTRELGKDRRYVYTGTEEKTYGRFYGLDTTGDYYENLQDEDLNGFYAIYSGRDSVAKLDHNVGGHERRSGYGFIRNGVQDNAERQYELWQKALKEYEERQKKLEEKLEGEYGKDIVSEEQIASPSDAKREEEQLIPEEDKNSENMESDSVDQPEINTPSNVSKR